MKMDEETEAVARTKAVARTEAVAERRLSRNEGHPGLFRDYVTGNGHEVSAHKDFEGELVEL